MSGRCILVVEDDRDTCLALQFMLESWDCQVVVAHGLDDAAEACRAHDISLVLLDHNLGSATGVEVLPYLVRAGGRPRIVMLSGHAPESFLHLVDEQRIDAVMHKPITPHALREMLDAMLNGER